MGESSSNKWVKAKGANMEVGDHVLVKIIAHDDGKHKLADKYEEELYDITESRRENIPVFRLKGVESGILHIFNRNHLCKR
ncbi:hypothetical protein DPMN_000999 [Dreissena polymorpha]|uniref:Uncharacterized protein n=1 Tax=Dreissena polymorpha TaxID=45954 RepID=A0A9D4MHQ5_DREPO|nr:hypothetical protein DPMN_000999 [Dreissena polymorpha]